MQIGRLLSLYGMQRCKLNTLIGLLNCAKYRFAKVYDPDFKLIRFNPLIPFEFVGLLKSCVGTL